jgi:poly(A) polymerase
VTEEDIKDSKRKPLEGRLHTEDGLILRDNVWGSPAEDAFRRDFTVNALFYNIKDFSIIDYAGGLEDLKAGRLRLIGDPEERYREDPVRMLRAIRFAAKLGFTIDGPSLAPISELKGHILSANSSRLYEELKKLWLSDEAEKGYQMMRTTGLFSVLFPETGEWLDIEEDGYPHTFLGHAFQWIEDEMREGREVTVPLLFAIILCGPIMARARSIQEKAGQKLPAIFPAVKEVISGMQSRISIPRRDTDAIKGILYGEQRFPQIRGKRPFTWVKNPHFADAFRYFKMKNSLESDDGELLAWWDKFMETAEPWSPPKREAKKSGRRRRPRRRPPVKT